MRHQRMLREPAAGTMATAGRRSARLWRPPGRRCLGYARAGFGCGGGAKATRWPAPPLAAAVTPGLAAGQSGWLRVSQAGSLSTPFPVSSLQPTRSSCGLPSPAPPLASLPPPSRASAAGAQGIRLSSPPRGVYLRRRRSRSWAGLAATSEQSPPAGAAQFAVSRGATPRAPEGRALTAEAGLMPGGAAASGRRLACGERAATPRDRTPEASSERGVSCLRLPSLRASARRRDTLPAGAGSGPRTPTGDTRWRWAHD
ncbi:uncharacterized protein [Muntiacus reevesi]|uniref:uncharacterized protein n=1 Tax=Muntiacus reevesi TaxID=9886 RepID=UPI00330728DC